MRGHPRVGCFPEASSRSCRLRREIAVRSSCQSATPWLLPHSLQVSVLAREGLHDEMVARVQEALASTPCPPPPLQSQGPILAAGERSSAPVAGPNWGPLRALEPPLLDTATANIALRALASQGKVSLSLPSKGALILLPPRWGWIRLVHSGK